MEIDPELVIPNKNLTLARGRHPALGARRHHRHLVLPPARGRGRRSTASRPTCRCKDLKPEHLDLLLYGDRRARSPSSTPTTSAATHYYDTTFEGVIPNLERRYRETESDYVRAEIERYMAASPCPACKGARLKPESLAVTIGGKNIIAVDRDERRRGAALVRAARRHRDAALNEREQTIAHQILKEIRARLDFLVDVGLDYLTLDRAHRHALRRRGPAHPPGHADRLRPDGRALRLRRADRSACTPPTTTA